MVALSVPDVGWERTSQLLLPASPLAAQETGRAQLPVSLTEKLCAGGAACPCAREKWRLAGPICNEHGGSTVNVSVIVCGLPCKSVLDPSVAVRVICAVYVLGDNPAMLAPTLIEVDWPLATNVPDAGVNWSQAGAFATCACQLSGQLQLPDAVIEIGWEAGEEPPWVALKATALNEGFSSVQGGSTRRLIVIV